MNPNDIVKNVYNRLKVEEYLYSEKVAQNNGKSKNLYYYRCSCSCGKNDNVICERQQLRFNVKGSCGCLHREQLQKRNKETASLNGDSKNEYKGLYHSWIAMKNRCLSDKNKHYDLYGGRGITIYDEWLIWNNFKSWALSNGWEEGLTIDRKDYNGNYEPNNCRWSTMEEQTNNTSKNKYLTYKGKTQTLAQWCKELNLDYHRTKARLNNCHMSVEQAFELPKQMLKRKVVND